MEIKYTPMIEQYLGIKKDYADCLVFFRLGDFYEMFFDDAILAAKELEIALTARDGGVDEKIPMCGVPYHSVTPYIEKLINKGYKVVIAEQVSEPGKGLVERKVTKLITPGMVVDDGILDQKDNNYIGAIAQDRLYFSLCYSDISTSEIKLINHLRKEDLLKQISKIGIKEIVVSDDLLYLEKEFLDSVLVSKHNNYLENFSLLADLDSLAKKGAGLLLSYLSSIEEKLINGFKNIVIQEKGSFLELDKNSLLSLELTNAKDKKDHSLFKLLDKNQTAMGSRLLKKMISSPLTNLDEIEKRLDFLQAFKDNKHVQKQITEALKGVYDIKRISARIASENSTPKDFAQLRITLTKIPPLLEALKKFDSKIVLDFQKQINPHQELLATLTKAITNNPPLTIKEGGIFLPNYNQELDQLKLASKKGKEWIKEFAEKEKQRTGIKNLKVGFNRVFGYYIEISKGNVHLVDESFGYIRKQTLVNSERFINEELKVKEEIILNASTKSVELEYELFIEFRKSISKYHDSLSTLADKIAYIDTMNALAIIANQNHYIRPEFNKDQSVFISGARHPMVEHFNPDPFIENDVSITDSGILLITGPNMSGKSTYMRMLAVIVVMAQMGSFVPARVAKLPVFDAIYTRIGAQDDLTAGRSTFMVEMLETNQALKNATPKSLLIFDEIGRGTATYDGMALAQGIIEYVHEKVKSVMLFSTHYHEITKLEKALKRLKNIHVQAVLEKGKLIFLHKIKEGPTDKSYGINVAALAKLPKPLIKRSQVILDHLEVDKKKEIELNIFNYQTYEELPTLISGHEIVLNKIKDINVDSLTPIEALLLLKEIQDDLK